MIYRKVFKWLKLALREIGNFLTNLLIPFIVILVFAIELLPIPNKKKILEILKKVEHWAFFACGTANRIYDKIDKEFNTCDCIEEESCEHIVGEVK